MGSQDRTQGFAVPILLERPHREERGHLVVAVGGCDEQITEVADGVVLDVMHVPGATQRCGVERLAFELVEVDAIECDGR